MPPPFIKALFNEVKLEMLKIALISTFLDTIMVFFVVYFVVSFFNIKFMYLLLIPGLMAVIFFFVSILVRIKRLRLKSMEDANPQIKEMLRTAHDNMDAENNIMAAALFAELKEKMKTVSSGNLLESKKVVTRIISTVIIVFLIITVSAFNVNLKKIDIPFEKLRFMVPGAGPGVIEGNLTTLVFNETDVVYGDASIAKLGNEEIDLNMNPTISEIDFNKISEAEQNELREGGVPQEIGVTPDAFNNQQVLDEAEQAANYSQRIKNI
ncbi:hypothetical protein JW756_01320 [Candidatus Woesearchaeota archaeon]|nr:hypothetical protein [Candidatus Woesearchaeota archaeon]